MKKTFAVLSIFSLVFFYGCKKDKQAEPTPITNSTHADYYDGILTATLTQTVITDTIENINYKGGAAWFGNTPSPGPSYSNFVTVDSVTLNGNDLNLSNYYYFDSTFSITGFPIYYWHVNGNHGIPNIDFTNLNMMPSYNAYASLPDSADHTQNLIVPISGIASATTMMVLISDASGHVISRNPAVSATSVVFTASELSTFGPDVFLYIDLYNDNAQTIGGKKFNFKNQYQLNKYLIIY